MNRFVAACFAGVLCIVHLAALFLLVTAVGANNPDWGPWAAASRREYLAALGVVPPGALIAVCALGYVVVTGVISTFVAININLERIADRLEREG